MRAIAYRINTGLLVLVLLTLLAVVGLLANRAIGGPLDPTEPPASTMKSLDDIPGSWNRVLPADDGGPGPNPPAGCDSSRFECVEDMSNNGVLDRETGLVWELDATCCEPMNWVEAQQSCMTTRYNTAYGFRMGWRLPTWEELQSLVQHFVAPPLPPGHPFIIKTDVAYWSATSISANTAAVYRFDGTLGTASLFEPKTNVNYVWCVRTGRSND